MTIANMNAAQMMILESFASVKSQEELKALMRYLKNFYAHRLDEELEKLWEDGTLNQEKLDQLREEHFRTPYASK